MTTPASWSNESIVLAIALAADTASIALAVIIGSGAAAAMLAHTLVARGRDVLMLERGDYVERSQMSDDEAEMFANRAM
jgi:choline dehydrogenase-like flavoprotein